MAKSPYTPQRLPSSSSSKWLIRSSTSSPYVRSYDAPVAIVYTPRPFFEAVTNFSPPPIESDQGQPFQKVTFYDETVPTYSSDSTAKPREVPLIDRLRRHYRDLAPHVKERMTARLLYEAIERIEELEAMQKRFHPDPGSPE